MWWPPALCVLSPKTPTLTFLPTCYQQTGLICQLVPKFVTIPTSAVTFESYILVCTHHLCAAEPSSIPISLFLAFSIVFNSDEPRRTCRCRFLLFRTFVVLLLPLCPEKKYPVVQYCSPLPSMQPISAVSLSLVVKSADLIAQIIHNPHNFYVCVILLEAPHRPASCILRFWLDRSGHLQDPPSSHFNFLIPKNFAFRYLSYSCIQVFKSHCSLIHPSHRQF